MPQQCRLCANNMSPPPYFCMAGVEWVTGLRWCPEFRPIAAVIGKIKEVPVSEEHTLMPGASPAAQMNHADARARTQADLQAKDMPWTCAKRKVVVTKARCAMDKIAAVRAQVKGHPCRECGLPVSLKWVTKADLGLETALGARG